MNRADKLAWFVEATVAGFVVLFGTWTLVVHVSGLVGATYGQLHLFSPIALLAAAAIWFWWQRMDHTAKAVAAPIACSSLAPDNSKQETQSRLIWLGATLACVGAYALSGRYEIFWLGVIVVLFAGLIFQSRSPDGISGYPLNSAGAFITLGVVLLLAFLVPLIAHRPDTDDALYISLANDSINRPDIPVLQKDAFYGVPDLPIMLQVYRVESWELLLGLFSKVLRLEPIISAHVFFPPVWAAITVLAWAAFFRTVTPRAWPYALVMALLLMLLLRENHHSLGNFGFLRFQQGKAVMLTLQVPLACLFAWRFGSCGRWADLLLLFFVQIGGIGFSSTGLLAMPATIGVAILSTASFDRQWLIRASLALSTISYSAIAALLVRSGLGAMANALNDWPSLSLDQVIVDVFGRYGRFLLLGGAVSAWTLVWSTCRQRWLLLSILLLFIGPLNPWLTPWVAKYVTSPPALWRLLWIFPFAPIAAISLGELCMFGRRPALRAATAITLIVCMLITWNCLTGSVLRYPGSLEFGRLDVDEPEFSTARLIAQVTPNGRAALAPETVAAWLTTFRVHPRPVYVRSHYLLYLQGVLEKDDLAGRFRLWHLLDDPKSDETVDFLLESIDRYSIGSITLAASVPTTPAIEALLTAHGWSQAGSGPYHVWVQHPTGP